MKKVLMGLAVVIILGVGILWAVVQLAGRDVPPPDDAEFAAERPEVAPEDNAFTYFLQATNLLVQTTNSALQADYLAGKPVDEGELRDLVAQNADGLALVRRGTECAICLMPTVDSCDSESPYLGPWLKIGKVLAVQSRQARLAGRTEESVAAALTAARLGNLVQKDAESMLHYLAGAAIVNQALEQALEWAGDPQTPAAALDGLATELDGLGPFDGGLARAFKAECRLAVRTTGQLADGQIDLLDLLAFGNAERNFRTRCINGILRSGYFFQPRATGQRLQEVFRRMVRNVSLPYAQIDPDDGREFGRSRLDFLGPNSVGRLLRILLIPPLGITMDKKCRTEAMLAGAKLAVACRRFARARGRFPETLPELVPEYLAEVPRDPFDGQPFRYSAEKEIAWSVGKNLTDEGGSTRMESPGKEYLASRDRPQAEDFVFELKPTEKPE